MMWCKSTGDGKFRQKKRRCFAGSGFGGHFTTEYLDIWVKWSQHPASFAAHQHGA
jgi:hypothetical protein